ncbi:MAG: S4 domain-containing protein [Oscillospiraceae bacterium]
MERLDKLLAATGQWSRKEAKALVKAGRVQVGAPGPRDRRTRWPKAPRPQWMAGPLPRSRGFM